MNHKKELDKEISKNREYATIPLTMRISKEAEEALNFLAYQLEYEEIEEVIEFLARFNNEKVNEILNELGVEFKSDF